MCVIMSRCNYLCSSFEKYIKESKIWKQSELRKNLFSWVCIYPNLKNTKQTHDLNVFSQQTPKK